MDIYCCSWIRTLWVHLSSAFWTKWKINERDQLLRNYLTLTSFIYLPRAQVATAARKRQTHIHIFCVWALNHLWDQGIYIYRRLPFRPIRSHQCSFVYESTVIGTRLESRLNQWCRYVTRHLAIGRHIRQLSKDKHTLR